MLPGAKKLSSGCGIAEGPFIVAWRSICRHCERSGHPCPLEERLDASSTSLRAMTEERQRSRHQMEGDAAEQKRIARYRHVPSPSRRRGPRRCRATRNVSPLMISLAPLTKRKLQLGSSSSGSPLVVLADGNSDDPAPMLGQALRIRALHLDAGQRLRHVLADRFLPVRPGRRIGPRISSLPSVWLNSMKAARQSRGCSCTP